MSSSKASNEPINFSLYGGAESFPSAPRSSDKERTRRTVVESPLNNLSPYPAAGTPPKDPSDFLWLMTEEPHRSRRMEIMKAHPEVRLGNIFLPDILLKCFTLQVTKLMGYEPLTKYVVIFVVLLQVSLAFLLRHTSPFSPIFLLTAYVVGGTANHNLFLAIHEITHNLAFKTIFANRALAVVANLPIGIPYAAAFKVHFICMR
jgi:sphingolipid 4-desaturase/C4-monooxygenase